MIFRRATHDERKREKKERKRKASPNQPIKLPEMNIKIIRVKMYFNAHDSARKSNARGLHGRI